jgi:predicted helicase
MKTRLVPELSGWGKMKTIHEVLQGLRDVSLDERDKGNHFESLTKRWLEISPEYADIFEKVWTYPEWAAENDLPKTDVGIDLVAREVATGDLCAIQCKFYDPGTSIDKRHIDSFFTALSKKHFSSGIIFSTSTKWSKHAEDALAETTKPVVRVGLHDLEDSGVDWDKFSLKNPGKLELKTRKTPYKHQELAINDVLLGFSSQDRGKLIMACGTGKTFTSLKIAEAMVPDGGTMLFLVPSIALLSQSLREWKLEADRPITAYAVCSDSKVGKSKDDEDIQVTDLAYPATTNAKKLIAHFSNSKTAGKGFTVIFSTYQSIDVISKAQALGVPEFDLIVCDEAHRTTGVKLADADESSFIRVHDNKFVEAKKRLYMTATPRIYAEQSKQKALESDATLASMDDDGYYGKEFHRLNFGKAVSQGLLSDYKVLVLAVSEDHVSRQLQKLLTKDGELNLDDATKIVGCYNGLLKRSSNPDDFVVDTAPMRSAVAFSRSIKDSKRLASLFEMVTAELNKNEVYDHTLNAEADHVDGTYNMESRLEKLDWLKEKTTDTVRILSNARCLSEGVDVPALDAVLFLNPRDSQVDVVQSVGRVMRKSPGKQYGYVILPITVPAGKTAEEALADNSKYKVVWQVLQALRSHDERFDAMVNKIDLNGDADERLRVIGVGDGISDEDKGDTKSQDTKLTLDFPLGEWRDAILAKIVQKVGQRTYWENWAQDVATIATDNISRITSLLDSSNSEVSDAFSVFLKGLQDNLNPFVTKSDAIEMLAQHLITKPVFEALFEGYSFTKLNPVSIAMQSMLDVLQKQTLDFDASKLEDFYSSVRARAQGITDGGAKQKIVKELYEKFFKLAFAGTSDRLGIVYTPNEIVDFINKSVDDILRNEFKSSIDSEGVHVLDPFTGTGTFMVRLLQSNLIGKEHLARKYAHELHANELVLLAYYVAAINIEETFHSLVGGEYQPFDGIVLTDTFQMHESDDKDEMEGTAVFPENNTRVLDQKSRKIQVILGNPPYSVGQTTANENNGNLAYPTLDSRIDETYAEKSTAGLKKSLYDSYIRAFRWASDRLDGKGVICFVSNGGFMESNSADGFRKSLEEEFSSLYIFNLRGNQRSAGEESRKEGGKVFGAGSRNTIAISLLVKNPESKEIGKVFYHDIGSYLSREEKLAVIAGFGSYQNVPWQLLETSAQGDWLNVRNAEFANYIPLANKENPEEAIFQIYSRGVLTARDAWMTNFSRSELERNVKRIISTYNSELDSYNKKLTSGTIKRDVASVRSLLSRDSAQISWDGRLENYAVKNKRLDFDASAFRVNQYRPFTLQNLYMHRDLNNSVYQMPKLFPESGSENFGFYTTAPGSGHPFTAFATKYVPDIAFWGSGSGQFYPRYIFNAGEAPTGLFDFGENTGDDGNLGKNSLEMFSKTFGSKVSADDLFFYIYAILNCPEYKETFADDLKLMLPRIPVSRNFVEFCKIGRAMFELHSNFEAYVETPLEEISNGKQTSKIEKMKLVKGADKTLQVVVNSSLTLAGIPEAVLDFRLGSRSGIEWVVERFQVKTEKESGITNDPNSWGAERHDAEYVVKLISKVVGISLDTLEMQKDMPKLEPIVTGGA